MTKLTNLQALWAKTHQEGVASLQNYELLSSAYCSTQTINLKFSPDLAYY